jgi:hypothetical protein
VHSSKPSDVHRNIIKTHPNESVPKVMLVPAHGGAYEQHMKTVKVHHVLDQEVSTFRGSINAAMLASNASTFESRILCNLSASLTRCKAH